MTVCPICNLMMESHSTNELLECCMKQAGNKVDKIGVCPSCKHEIVAHTNDQLAECTIDFLKLPADKYKT